MTVDVFHYLFHQEKGWRAIPTIFLSLPVFPKEFIPTYSDISVMNEVEVSFTLFSFLVFLIILISLQSDKN